MVIGIGIILLWILIGICAYIWFIKDTHTTYFNEGEFIFHIIFGPIVILVLTCIFIHDKFHDFMEDLVRKINK